MYRYTATAFRRGAPTVLSYAALLCFTFWNYGYGPALTLLRAELHFSYTLLGVYTAAWSAGAVLTGIAFPALARRVSRAGLLWGSALLSSAGAVLFVLGPGVAPTLIGGGLLGLGGTTLLTVIQAVLSDQHGDQRERALTEANMGAAACAVLAPLVLGALAGTVLGWRAAFVLPVLGLVVLNVRYRRHPLPRAAPDHPAGTARLPRAALLFAGLVAASMAVEFCLVYYGAEQLAAIGLPTAAAATAMSAHYVGLLVGRVAGALATRRPGRTTALQFGSLAGTAVGFALFWLAPLPVAVVGLFLAGVGIANLYPLALALALGSAPGREDRVNALSQVLGGLLVVGAPFALGALADAVGLTAAYTVEPVLIGLCLLLLLSGLRSRS
ncbi:MFS transporter [Pseudonocardia sp. CA-107938]|uniref:MFS transporter n=1 Tax=Pseudonocardia sp. CA-107938 TaxID=3240021 RepID=UPI003D90D738